jgi:DNA invertase Pin-like site-specific DNA recombinase
MKFVSYCRVSTQRQGASGLGLEAQDAAVASYVAAIPGATVIERFVEVESGRKSNRPELTRALNLCHVTGAVLLVAKLDRLSRSVRFISEVLDAGVEIRACDIPSASRMVLHILSAVAEEEARAISARTKAALTAAKARGKRLGNPALAGGGDAAMSAKGVEANQSAAVEYAQRVAPFIRDAKAAGATSLRALAQALTARGVKTRTGKTTWFPAQVRNVLATMPVA